jgi:copper ion binding protein
VSEQKGHRVLVGGKFGRFHQVGYELFKMADHDLLMKSLEASIQTIKENAVGEESLYSIINRLGVAPIFMRLYKGDELMTQKTTISVKGMNCQHCVDHVTKALGSLPGVSKVAVDLKTEKATVEFDPAKAGLTEMTRAIEKAGYRVAGSPAVSPETPSSGDSCC